MVHLGIDAVEVSTGSNIFTAIIPVLKKGDPEQTYFRSEAAAVKRAVDIPVMVVAGIRSLQVAKGIVDSGDADLISMCRPFIREPHLVARWQKGDVKAATCISCNGCAGIVAKGRPLRCGQEK
jgi:2,4-dienoyl-CoA reductase-like NADH-dependent reductase (Old Yellow Enzyme family)